MNRATDEMLAAARQRGEAAAARPVRYISNAAYARQKAALTRAINSGDPNKIKETVVKTVVEWNAEGYAWPDDWSRWQRALDDVMGVYDRVLLEDIR